MNASRVSLFVTVPSEKMVGGVVCVILSEQLMDTSEEQSND
jgi:hypothetical protein